jgi:hypothetical protein
MFQRKAVMKPAVMDSRAKVDLYDLIIFFNEAKGRFESKNEPDTAFAFEMLCEYFEKDFKPGQKLKFTGTAVGL